MEIEGKKRFLLREAYAFASENGLGDQVDDIRELEIEWDRGYTSTVRRGRLIRLFQEHELLPKLIARDWPFGATPRGETERRRCLRIGDEYDAFLSGKLSEEDVETDTDEGESLEFALEAHLRDFLAKNLGHIMPHSRNPERLTLAAGARLPSPAVASTHCTRLFRRAIRPLRALLRLFHRFPDILLYLLHGLPALLDFLLLGGGGSRRGARGFNAAACERRGCDNNDDDGSHEYSPR